jgi:hypothetical protein
MVCSKLVDQIALGLFKPYPGCDINKKYFSVESGWEEFIKDMEYPIYRLPNLSSAEIAKIVIDYKLTVLKAYQSR